MSVLGGVSIEVSVLGWEVSVRIEVSVLGGVSVLRCQCWGDQY